MSFLAQFYKYGKRENSFRVPYPDEAIESFTQSVELKDTTSVINPVILVNLDGIAEAHDTAIYRYNYIYIPKFERYYYIDDWVYTPPLWAAYCHVDALGSWRYPVLEHTFYLTRTSYDDQGNLLFNANVGDSKYPVICTAPVYQETSTGNPYSGKEGVYVVGIINSSSNNGAVTYYVFNKIGFNYFCSVLFNYSSGWLNIDPTEISEDLQKALVNPFQYVVSCQYLPLNVGDIASVRSGTTTTISFGWWSVTVPQGAAIVETSARIRYTTSLLIPRNASKRGYYLNLSPYAMYTLRYYPYGTINIDSEAIANWSTLDLYSDVDIVTGKGILNIAVNGFNNPLQTIEAQVGVPIPTAALQTSYQNIATGSTAAMAAGATMVGKLTDGSALTKDWTTAKPNTELGFFKGFKQYVKDVASDLISQVPDPQDLKQTAADIFNVAVAACTTAEIRGMQGMASGYDSQSLTLSARFLPIAKEDLEHTGRPYMDSRKLSTVRGFTIVKDADINIPCTDREKKTIISYLESGVYVE